MTIKNIFTRKINEKSEARIREWIAALVSGKYHQANGHLRANMYVGSGADAQLVEGFCCLGVICQIAKPEGWQPYANLGHEWGKVSARNGYLDKAALRKYNLSDAGQKELARRNDAGYTFGEVAVFIAEQLGAKLAAQ